MGDPCGERLVELPGDRRHAGRRRFTIDASSIPKPERTIRTCNNTANVVVFAMRGELDASAAAAIGDRCVRHVDALSDACVDLSEVVLIDSSGVRWMEDFADSIKAGGGRFVLRDPSPIVQRVLVTLGVTFEAVDTIGETGVPDVGAEGPESDRNGQHASMSKDVERPESPIPDQQGDPTIDWNPLRSAAR